MAVADEVERALADVVRQEVERGMRSGEAIWLVALAAYRCAREVLDSELAHPDKRGRL